MARPRKGVNLQILALKRHEELLEKRTEIEDEIRGLKKYLKSMGAIKNERRGRKQAKGTVSKKVSATDAILSVIGKSKAGISIDGIMKDTGLGRLTVNGVLNRMKKAGKVKALKRGVYSKG